MCYKAFALSGRKLQNGSATRLVNISACTSATLSLNYRRNNLEADDNYYIDVNYGAGWTTLTNIGGVVANDSTINPTLHPSRPVMQILRSVYEVCFTNQGGTDQVFVDNVQIACTTQTVTAITRDNVTPGGIYPDLLDGNPDLPTPSLVVSGDNFVLNPGQSIIVTYQVKVNDPINPAGLASINNTTYRYKHTAGHPQHGLHIRYPQGMDRRLRLE